jgi:hypothetical protein
MLGGADPHWIAREAASRQLTVFQIGNEAAPGDADVILRTIYRNGASVELQTVSARTGEDLTTGKASYWGIRGFARDAMEHLRVNFAKGTELYKKIAAERAAERDAQRPAVGAGVSAADLERIVQKAVAGAAPPRPPEAAALKPSAVDAPSYKAGERPDDLGVVVGIEAYSDLPAARFAERDAAAVRRHFAALGIPERNIVSLLGAKASRAALVKTFETWLPANAAAGSTVWVYFSGHGAPEPASGSAYLLPWDGDPQFLDDTAYPLKRLYAKLDALKAKRVVLALDACFSGAGGRSVLAKGLRPLVAKVDTAVTGKTVALTASAAEEVTGTLEEEGHGLFTYHLLKGLNGAAADARGRVTLEGLHSYLQPQVRDEARRQNRVQTPQLLSAGAGAAVLLR